MLAASSVDSGNSYEDYSTTSNSYDMGRVTVGRSLIEEQLESVRKKRGLKSVAQLRILDAGCGTGNYIELLARIGCRNITGLELNGGMLAQSRKKHGGKEFVKLVKGSLNDPLPFAADSFDLVLVNQVLHHLDDARSRKSNFANMRQLFANTKRVLRKGTGRLLINWSSALQSYDTLWYMKFIPRAFRAYAVRCPTDVWFTETLQRIGFRVDSHSIVDLYISPQTLRDRNGVHRDDWRALDSTWALATEFELRTAQQSIDSLTDAEWKKEVSDAEYKRQLLGASTYFVAHKLEPSKL